MRENEPRDAPSPWLELSDDEGEGYTVIGDARALEILGTQCLRMAQGERSDETASTEIDGMRLKVVRQDARPASERRTWKDSLALAGCVVLLALLTATWLRGCAAIGKDVDRWLN